jgi:hypothetical protein
MVAGPMPTTLTRKTIINMTTWSSPDPDPPEPGLAGAPVEPAAGGTGPAEPEAGQTAPAAWPETAEPEPVNAEPEAARPEALPGPGLRPSL